MSAFSSNTWYCCNAAFKETKEEENKSQPPPRLCPCSALCLTLPSRLQPPCAPAPLLMDVSDLDWTDLDSLNQHPAQMHRELPLCGLCVLPAGPLQGTHGLCDPPSSHRPTRRCAQFRQSWTSCTRGPAPAEASGSTQLPGEGCRAPSGNCMAGWSWSSLVEEDRGHQCWASSKALSFCGAHQTRWENCLLRKQASRATLICPPHSSFSQKKQTWKKGYLEGGQSTFSEGIFGFLLVPLHSVFIFSYSCKDPVLGSWWTCPSNGRKPPYPVQRPLLQVLLTKNVYKLWHGCRTRGITIQQERWTTSSV